MTTAAILAQSQNISGLESRFVALVDQALASPALMVVAVAAAFGVGAVHALTPGHGKAIAAAYLVGGRGRLRDAVLLGISVALMHTASVLVLGAGLGVFLRAGAQPATPPDVVPGLRVVSGLVVVALGVFLVVRQVHGRRRPHTHDIDPEVAPFSRRGLVVVGLSGGLLPSPSAFLVLVTTSFSGRLGFGLLLVAVFSVGLASTLTAIGLAVVRGRQAVVDRVSEATQRRLARAAATAAAVVILAGGIVLTAAGIAAL